MEVEYAPTTVDGVDLRSVPLVDGAPLPPEAYTVDGFLYAMLELRGARMAELAALFADEELHPAVFFCVSGKDRTGLLSALVQSAIGVSDDDVADDFSLTERLMPEWHIERTLDLGSALDSSITREVVRESMRAPRELMVDALAKLRADHGDAAGYLRDHGLAQADLDRLRRALVEP